MNEGEIKMIGKIISDIKAVKKNDPSAKNYLEIILCHTPLWTIIAYRFSHALTKLKLRLLPKIIMTLMKTITSIDLNPFATIGKSFFIDHGVGVVIGETAQIGNDCIIFQNVTLGGTGKHTGKRHPTIGNNVLIGVGATLLGPITVGDNVKIGADTFVIMKNIPSNCTVVGAPGKIVKLNGKKVNIALKKSGN